MPIAPLPDSTVRAIGSSLVLHDACSVVKELVENALDANATSVTVETSLNTLEVIQVKDNGHGIGIEDRQLVCKRGYTSKIRTIEDLQRLSGSSLGFRGEALASLAELSSVVTFTTRVDGEMVGTTLTFGKDGALKNSGSASHPVGTTCRIQGFLHALPVRKETARKCGSKTIASIKKLLFNYAYARPSVRFALKILKSSHQKSNWSYAPSVSALPLQGATTKILGQEVAALCELRSAYLQQTQPELAGQDVYSVDAVLAKTDAEPSKIHNLGHYVSIDGRPVDPARGVIKDVVKRYKSIYRAVCHNANHMSSNVDPFLCMQIRCPQQSYDVNVEPAKDDLLFSDPSKIMALAEQLFTHYYGKPASETPTRSGSSATHRTPPTADNSFDLLLARKAPSAAKPSLSLPSALCPQLPVSGKADTGVPHEESPRNAGNSGHAPASVAETTSSDWSDRLDFDASSLECKSGLGRSDLFFNMYGADDEDLLITSSPRTEHADSREEDEDALQSGNVTNPWSLAKLSASTRQSVREQSITADEGHTAHPSTPGSALNCASRSQQQRDFPTQSTRPESSLPSPVPSSPTPLPCQNLGPPARRRAYNAHQDRDAAAAAAAAIRSPQGLLSQPSRHSANTIHTWAQPWQPTVRLPWPKRNPVSYTQDRRVETVDTPHIERSQDGLERSVSGHLAKSESLLTEPPVDSNHVSEPLNSLFQGRSPTSPGLVANINGPDSPCADARSTSPRPRPAMSSPTQGLCSQRQLSEIGCGNQVSSMTPYPSLSQRLFEVSQVQNTELADILEFEQRKKAAVLRQRQSQSDHALGERSPVKIANFQGKVDDKSSIYVVPSRLPAQLCGTNGRGEESSRQHHVEHSVPNFLEEARGLTQRNSPHHNRYLAAKQRLENANLQSDQSQRASQPNHERCRAREPSSEPEVGLSEDDPRAYLARIRESGQRMDGLSGSAMMGRKLRRMKTARLPLETVPGDAANHGLKVVSPHPIPCISILAVMSGRQGQYDEYVRSGGNSFVKWSANSGDVTAWQITLEALISKSYRARLAGGEVVSPEVTVMLSTAVKEHVDVYGP